MLYFAEYIQDVRKRLSGQFEMDAPKAIEGLEPLHKLEMIWVNHFKNDVFKDDIPSGVARIAKVFIEQLKQNENADLATLIAKKDDWNGVIENEIKIGSIDVDKSKFSEAFAKARESHNNAFLKQLEEYKKTFNEEQMESANKEMQGLLKGIDDFGKSLINQVDKAFERVVEVASRELEQIFVNNLSDKILGEYNVKKESPKREKIDLHANTKPIDRVPKSKNIVHTRFGNIGLN